MTLGAAMSKQENPVKPHACVRWCEWLANLVLLPICFYLIFQTALSFLPVELDLSDPYELDDYGSAKKMTTFEKWVLHHYLKQMTPDQRLIAMGDAFEIKPVVKWKKLADRYSEQPLCQLQFLSQLVAYYDQNANPSHRDKVIKRIERVKHLDQDNGVYDLFQAMVLMGDFDVIDDESMQFTLPGIRESDEDAVYFPMDFSKPVEMTEIHAVMEALQRAVNHPYIDTHVFDFLAYRLEQLPDRHSLYDYLLQLDAALFPLNPTLGLNRKLTRYVCAAAVQVARQGKTDTAIALLDCITLYHQKLAASSHDRIGLLVAYNCKVMAHVTRVFVYQMASDTSASQKAMADFKALRQDFIKNYYHINDRDALLQKTRIPEQQHSELMHQLGVLEEFEPLFYSPKQAAVFREVEYIHQQRWIIWVWMVVLTLWMTLILFVSMINACKERRLQNDLLFIWVGWQNFLLIMLFAWCVPIFCFALIQHLPLLGWEYGARFNPLFAIWHVLLFFVIMTLSYYLMSHALKSKCRAKDIDVPTDRLANWVGQHKWVTIIGVIALLGIVGFLLQMSPFITQKPMATGLPTAVPIASMSHLAMFGGIYVFLMAYGFKKQAFNSVVSRSATVILLAGVLLLGLGVDPVLQTQISQHIQEMRKAVPLLPGDQTLSETLKRFRNQMANGQPASPTMPPVSTSKH